MRNKDLAQKIEDFEEMLKLNNIRYSKHRTKPSYFIYDINNKKYMFNAVSGKIDGYKDNGAVTMIRIALLDIIPKPIER